MVLLLCNQVSSIVYYNSVTSLRNLLHSLSQLVSSMGSRWRNLKMLSFNLVRRYGASSISTLITISRRCQCQYSLQLYLLLNWYLSTLGRSLTFLAGIPATTAYGSTSFVTTQPAQHTAPSPIWTPGRTITLLPSHAYLSMVTFALSLVQLKLGSRWSCCSV